LDQNRRRLRFFFQRFKQLFHDICHSAYFSGKKGNISEARLCWLKGEFCQLVQIICQLFQIPDSLQEKNASPA
jgi:hypothetical protein